jgi:L-iditol 2-dehydrogenase
MKTAFLKNMNDIAIKDVQLWKLEQNEIRIRVDACGVCGTDVLNARDGKDEYSPFGHEVAGTILEIGSAVTRVKVGQKVALESASACGECLNCRDTRQELCTDIKSFFFKTSFGFAEEMISPAISAIPFDGMTAEEACVSEPLGVAIDLHRLADIQIGSHVVVSGLGPIGLMAVRLAKLSGAEKVYACDLSSATARLAMAKRWGADEIIEVDKTPIEGYQFEKAPDRFMITSPPRTLPPMMKVAAKGAIISFIGIKFGDAGIISFDANDFHFKKLQLRASFASPALYTPMALNLIAKGIINARELISHTFSLEQIPQAMKTAADSQVSLKVIVKPNERKA